MAMANHGARVGGWITKEGEQSWNQGCAGSSLRGTASLFWLASVRMRHALVVFDAVNARSPDKEG
eukprot:9960600-Alexandrium_andersonii.AAC.1